MRIVPLTIYSIFIGKWSSVGIMLSISIGIVACFLLAKYKNIRLGTSLFISFIFIGCCFFIWTDEGLTDEALFAFPGILIFATFIANFRLAMWLLLFMLINIIALGYVNETGLYITPPNTSDLGTALYLVAILIVTTFSVSLISKDLHSLLRKLESENNKVKQSKQEIIRLQNHDPLTGLPNRILTEEIFNKQAELGVRQYFKTALLFLVLDNFKSINDT